MVMVALDMKDQHEDLVVMNKELLQMMLQVVTQALVQQVEKVVLMMIVFQMLILDLTQALEQQVEKVAAETAAVARLSVL